MCGPCDQRISNADEVVAPVGVQVVPALAKIIGQMAAWADSMEPCAIDAIAPAPEGFCLFDAAGGVPSISLHDYLCRMQKLFQCSNECFVLSMVYIDRILTRNPGFRVSLLNAHKLLVTSVVLAVKFHEDALCSNAYYASVAGVDTRDLNALEEQFLRMVDWRVHVLPEDFKCHHTKLFMWLEKYCQVPSQKDLQEQYVRRLYEYYGSVVFNSQACDGILGFSTKADPYSASTTCSWGGRQAASFSRGELRSSTGICAPPQAAQRAWARRPGR